MAHTQLRKTGNFEAFIDSVKATGVLGGSVWKFSIDLPNGSGEAFVSDGKLLYLKVGDLKGNEALMYLRNYDTFSWSVEAFVGNVPEIHDIDIASVYLQEISPKIPEPKVDIIDGRFVDILKKLEGYGFTGMMIYEEYLAIFKGGSLMGIRRFSRLERVLDILRDLRGKYGRFYLIDFTSIERLAGFVYGLRDISDSPAGQWDAKKVKGINGTIEVSRGFKKILIVSDGKDVLMVLSLSAPPTFSENIPYLFLKGNLISTYPSADVRPVFKYTFSDAEYAQKLFHELIQTSRKFVGEVVFQKASQKVLSYTLPNEPYPDEVVEVLSTNYKKYEKEISVFTGKLWKQERERILSQYPGHISEIFNVSKPS